MPKEIKYIKGDATAPQGEGRKFIIHCCNDIGAWGAGFVLALSKNWPEPERRYKKWKRNGRGFKLGHIQVVRVEKDIYVINMIGQRDIKTKNGVPPIRYGSINKCLKKVAELAKEYKATVHAPRFGAGLAGGKWEKIEDLITEQLIDQDIKVTVYDID